MEETFIRSTIGTSGFLATIGLAPLNEALSVCVAIATLVYMGLSIYKLLNK